MKKRLKKIGYRIEDRLKSLCGELTPDKQIMIVLIMVLILAVGNLYFTFSTIYNWGRKKEQKEQLEIEHIKQLDLDRGNRTDYEFMDSIDERLFDMHRQRMEQNSFDSISSNEQRFKEYERTTNNKYPAEAKA